MALHPPWIGVIDHCFPEFCVSDVTKIKLTHVEGFVTDHITPIITPATYYVISEGHRKFLDTHGTDVWVWGNGVDVGKWPGNIQWQFVLVAGSTDTFYIISEGHRKFLDTHGKEVKVWGDGQAIGQYPAYIQWRLKPVAGKETTFYIINVGCGKFLDTHGKGVWVWGDGVEIGGFPANIQWKLQSKGN